MLQRISIFTSHEHACKIKTETIYVHFSDPILETVFYKCTHKGVIAVDGIPTAGVIMVDTAIMPVEVVCNIISKPLKIDCWTFSASFRSMVEDHIEDYTDVRPMKRLYHVSEFHTLAALQGFYAVTGMRREKTMRVVTPVVFQSEVGSTFRHSLFIECHNRHKLNMRYAERLKIRNLLYNAAKCPGVCYS